MSRLATRHRSTPGALRAPSCTGGRRDRHAPPAERRPQTKSSDTRRHLRLCVRWRARANSFGREPGACRPPHPRADVCLPEGADFMLPHFEPFGNHSFSACPRPAWREPATVWRRCRYCPLLMVVARSVLCLVRLDRIPLFLQAAYGMPARLSTSHPHVPWTVPDVWHQALRGLGRSPLVVWGEVPSWFGEKSPRGLERSPLVVWREVPSWFGEKKHARTC